MRGTPFVLDKPFSVTSQQVSVFTDGGSVIVRFLHVFLSAEPKVFDGLWAGQQLQGLGKSQSSSSYLHGLDRPQVILRAGLVSVTLRSAGWHRLWDNGFFFTAIFCPESTSVSDRLQFPGQQTRWSWNMHTYIVFVVFKTYVRDTHATLKLVPSLKRICGCPSGAVEGLVCSFFLAV